jgi:hypothetical protein
LECDRGAFDIEQVGEDTLEVGAFGQLGQHQARELVADHEVVGAGGAGEVDIARVEQLGHDPGPLPRRARDQRLLEDEKREQRTRIRLRRCQGAGSRSAT